MAEWPPWALPDRHQRGHLLSVEPLIHWPDPIRELAGFLASIAATGAVGFRYAALAPARRSADPGERAMAARAAAGAATIGLAGVLLGIASVAFRLPSLAARLHVTMPTLLLGFNLVSTLAFFQLLAGIGFALARTDRAAGWRLAATGVFATALRAALFMKWERLVNPVHELAAGLWIGSLFVMLAAGFPAALRSTLPRDRRGPAIATMVSAFSPLALVAAAVLAAFGVLTAWLHLGRMDALWNTPYGRALIAKLCVVLAVVGLATWNWRRRKPQLGSEVAALALERSARLEVALASVVLLVTAILVSLPAPGKH